MKEEIIKGVEETTADLLHTIASFSQEDFNKVPFEGSWTAAQVSEHILKSESGLPHVLTGPTIHTERRPDEKVPLIRSIFLDFTTKMQSPDFIVPSGQPHQKEEMLGNFARLRTDISALATSIDLSPTCTSFAIPQMGEFTRLEWLCFLISHSTRHIRQMKNIHQHLQNN